MSRPEDHLDNALCEILGLSKADQFLLPFWRAALAMTIGADTCTWAPGEARAGLTPLQEEGMDGSERKAA